MPPHGNGVGRTMMAALLNARAVRVCVRGFSMNSSFGAAQETSTRQQLPYALVFFNGEGKTKKKWLLSIVARRYEGDSDGPTDQLLVWCYCFSTYNFPPRFVRGGLRSWSRMVVERQGRRQLIVDNASPQHLRRAVRSTSWTMVRTTAPGLT